MIKEPKIIGMMKKAFKASGYTVARAKGKITIFTKIWAVQWDEAKILRKVLGTVVEHGGKLPEEGEAFTVSEHRVQNEMLPVALGQAASWFFDNHNQGILEAEVLPLTVHGSQVFQEMEGSRCFGIPIGLLDTISYLAIARKTDIVAGGEWAVEIWVEPTMGHMCVSCETGERFATVSSRKTICETEQDGIIWNLLEQANLKQRQ